MNRLSKLIQVVQRQPRLSTKEYAELVGRPHASVRRDLDQLAKQNAVRRARNWETLKWDGTWEAVRA